MRFLRRIPYIFFLLPGLLTIIVGIYICCGPYFTLYRHHRTLSWLSFVQNAGTYLGGVFVAAFGVAHCAVWNEVRKTRNKKLEAQELQDIVDVKVESKEQF